MNIIISICILIKSVEPVKKCSEIMRSVSLSVMDTYTLYILIHLDIGTLKLLIFHLSEMES